MHYTTRKLWKCYDTLPENVQRSRTGTNLVLLDPDIAKAFPTDASVNEALRLLLQIADRQQLNSSVEAE